MIFAEKIYIILTMKKILSAITVLLAASALTFAACAPAPDNSDGGGNDNGTNPDTSSYTTMRMTYSKLGTMAELRISADFEDTQVKSTFNQLCEDVDDFLDELEASLSTAVSTSSISLYNAAPAGEWVEVDELAYTVLSEAKYMYEYTQGNYNPAVYYSVDLFGFSPRFNTYTFEADISTKKPYDRVVTSSSGVQYIAAYEEPDVFYVNLFKDLASHMSEVELEERDGKHYAYKPDYTAVGKEGEEYTLAIDLGGIGKGYAADVVKQMAEDYGFDYGFFSFGSSSYYVFGNAGSGSWNMGLSDPDSYFGEAYANVKLSNVALSSSGDYEKYYISPQSGKRYCHIIDPNTGYPVATGMAIATVVGGTAARDDALTTALIVMGESKAVEFVNANLKSYKVAMLTRGTSGACERVVVNSPEFTIGKYTVVSTIDGDGNIVI